MYPKNNCTVIVSSCDSYEDTWVPFFKILKAEWPDRPYPIVLNTESKAFDYEDLNIKTFQFYKPGQKVSWGKRLIRTLKSIDTEYILFLLDDFFMLGKVDQTRIEQCLDWMDNDTNIAVFSFYRTHQPNIQDNKYPHFEKRPQNGEYRLNCQAAVWRREKLISYIRPHEDAWQWEVMGSKRSSRYKEDFYSAIEGEPYVFPYNCEDSGLFHGKWRKGTMSLLNKHHIEIDYSKRGLEGDMPKQAEILKVGIIKRKFNSLKYWISIWKSLK